VRAAGIPSTSCIEDPLIELLPAVSPLRLGNVEIAISTTLYIFLFSAEEKGMYVGTVTKRCPVVAVFTT
jgi:hypothetical protein